MVILDILTILNYVLCQNVTQLKLYLEPVLKQLYLS